MQNIRLDAGAAALLARLHGAGYAAYAVGGCVRDSLLGRTPQDWDLCTSARPEQVLALFGEGQCIPTGLQHGTVTIKYGGQLYETTTFRTEGPIPTAATRTRYTLCRMCGRTWPGGTLPSMPWPTTMPRGLSTPLGAAGPAAGHPAGRGRPRHPL